MSIYEERLRPALNDIARRFKLKNFRFEYNNVDGQFENFFGVIVPIILIKEGIDGEVCSRLLAKMPPNQMELRDVGVLEYSYNAETFFYTALLPCYKGLSKTDLSDLFAECYYADTTQFEEVIILGDVREKGFRRHEGNKFLDFDHVVVSLHSLAVFHALSMIFQNKTPDINSTHPNPDFLDFPPGFLGYITDSFNNNLEIFRDTKHEPFVKKLAANFGNAIYDCVHNAKHIIYGHGDFWKENIMYKYENNKPVKACILDFQTIRRLCPAQDVLSFLLTSVNAELRRNYYEYFVDTYYSSLRIVLLDHSLDLDKIYPKNDFKCDLKTVSSYCFLTASMSFSLWSGLEKKTVLKSKHICNDKNQNSAAVALYKQAIFDIADDFVTFGFYSA